MTTHQSESRRDVPTTPRNAMSGFHIRIHIFLSVTYYHLTNRILPNNLRSGLPRQHQHFLAIAIDVELPRANHSSQVLVVLQRHP